jgi:predicted RNA-binding Zn ribbon-like protein
MTTNKITPVMMTCQGYLVVTGATIDSVSELPKWYPGSENKLAPMQLLRVQGFINTRDLEEGTDLLAERESAQEWLLEAGLLEPGAELSGPDLALARSVREAIRALIELGGTDRGGDQLEPLRALAAEHRVRLAVADDGTIGLETPHEKDLSDALFGLLLIIHEAQQDETWSRLKLCANEECQWAFYDRSRNRQGNWCNMAVCGNRLKNREFRARRR